MKNSISINNIPSPDLKLEHWLQVNKNAWDLISPAHLDSPFYNISSFLVTKNSLHGIERRCLKNLAGKKVLHLQSHICTDSISLAAMGADVTAVDFSRNALDIGRNLSGQTNLPLKIVECNALDIDFSNEFNLAYLSYGALCWIPDLRVYFKKIFDSLQSSGIFYFVDFHANLLCYDTVSNARKCHCTSPQTPLCEHRNGSYAGAITEATYEVFYWIHSTTAIVTALIDAGFVIELYEEFDYLPFDCFPGLERENDTWRFSGNLKGMPLLVSMKAVKP